MVGVVGAERRDTRVASAEVCHRGHRRRGREQRVRQPTEHPVVLRTHPVDLVDEHEGRDAQSLQRPHQDAGLCLHAFDRGDDEHRAVEHVEHPLDLGDEVRVARCVDQVDRDVAEHERHDSRLDRDATLAFQRERVGLGAAVVDAADLVDDAGGVEQLFGQAGLAGVNMRQDPQVQCSQRISRPRSRWI